MPLLGIETSKYLFKLYLDDFYIDFVKIFKKFFLSLQILHIQFQQLFPDCATSKNLNPLYLMIISFIMKNLSKIHQIALWVQKWNSRDWNMKNDITHHGIPLNLIFANIARFFRKKWIPDPESRTPDPEIILC